MQVFFFIIIFTDLHFFWLLMLLFLKQGKHTFDDVAYRLLYLWDFYHLKDLI